jgi:hypothetical protein
LPHAKAPPRAQRIAHAAQTQSAGKIIAAAGRNNQHRQAELHQRGKVTMDGSVAAEQQENVNLVRGVRHSDTPVDGFARPRTGGLLKDLKVLSRASQPEDCRGAHVRAESNRVEPHGGIDKVCRDSPSIQMRPQIGKFGEGNKASFARRGRLSPHELCPGLS